VDHSRYGLGFSLKTLAEDAVDEELRLDELDRHSQSDRQIVRGKDVAHGAATQPFKQTIAVPDNVADGNLTLTDGPSEVVG
jgi:hypothetical protein